MTERIRDTGDELVLYDDQRTLGVCPHRHPVHAEPPGDGHHALAVRSGSSDSVHFLLRQRGSATSTRVPDDVESLVEHEWR